MKVKSLAGRTYDYFHVNVDFDFGGGAASAGNRLGFFANRVAPMYVVGLNNDHVDQSP